MPRKEVNHLHYVDSGKSPFFFWGRGVKRALRFYLPSANPNDYKGKNKILVINLIALGC